MKQESHSSSSSPSSLTVGEISVREREDAPDSDTSPVQVSNSVDDQGNLMKPKPIKIQNPTKRKPRSHGNSLNSEIPEWLQELRENLVDDGIPLQGGSHASSSHEVS